MLDADYTTALSLLLHYSLPSSAAGPQGLVKDAVFLGRNRSSEAGTTLIKRHSGRSPETKAGKQAGYAKRNSTALATNTRRQERSKIQTALVSSPNRLSANFLSQQKGLEALFQEVSGEVQRRTEGWSLARAVKGAVGEVRRNVQSVQPEIPAPITRRDVVATASREREVDTDGLQILTHRIQELEDRNKILAKMLGTILDSLRERKENATDKDSGTENEDHNIILAKLQFVQVYLADPEIPIPAEESPCETSKEADDGRATITQSTPSITENPALVENQEKAISTAPESPKPAVPLREALPVQKTKLMEKERAVPRTELPPRRQQRPSLAESSFSFMLGEGRHRSSFVSSASAPPEQRRGSDPKSNLKQPVVGDKEVAVKGINSEDDGFTMSSLRGFEKR